MTRADANAGVVYGVLGNYAPDSNDPEDECYGLYLQIDQHSIFVDIREDKYLEQRKLKALQLVENCKTLQISLENFVLSNPTFKSRSVSYIGLHSKNLDQGEVFWDPTGYTLLRGVSFVLE
jgi:hypothetical protein